MAGTSRNQAWRAWPSSARNCEQLLLARLAPLVKGWPGRCRIPAVTAATRWPEAHATRGLVATPHVLASDAGLGVLRAGGNAVDAAIAAATTIAVVYPHMNSIGGDNLWLLYDAGR